MAKLGQLSLSNEAMKKGVWKDFIPFLDVKIQLLIASSLEVGYLREVTKIIREHLKEIREDQTGSLESELIKPAVARHLLLGWRDIQDDDGKEIPYSFEAALGLLNNKELFHLYDFVRVQANSYANFRKEIAKDTIKN